MRPEARKRSSAVERAKRPDPNDLEMMHAYIGKGELPPLWQDFERFTVGTFTHSQYPCFDNTVLQYILSQAEAIARIPKGASLVNFAEQMTSPKVFVNLQKIAEYDHERACGISDVFAAYFIDPRVWKDERISKQLFNLLRVHPECFVENRYKVTPHAFTEHTVQARWPEDIIQKANEWKLSLLEKYELIDILQRELFFYHGDLKRDLHFSPNISLFLQQYHALFTPAVVQSVINAKSNQKISQKNIEQAWIDGHKSTDLSDFVSALYGKQSITVLNSFRHYRSCSETEPRLRDELNKNKAVVLKMSFPSGAEAVFACKFREVTIAVCMRSTHGLFKAGESYLPVGKTLKWVNSLSRGEYVELDIRDNQDPQIWAFNRKVNYPAADWQHIVSQTTAYAAKAPEQALAAK